MKRLVSCIMLTLLMAGMIFIAVDIKRASATAVIVYINSDGSISPVSAPISSYDDVIYTLTGNISYPAYAGIVVARSNIVLNGNGFTVQGNQTSPGGNGIDLTDTNNVTIKNTVIQYFDYGIYLMNSNREWIIQNNATSNTYDGITLDSSSSYNSVTGNIVTANTNGISVYSSSNNIIAGNYAAGNGYGIYVSSSSNVSIVGNTAIASNVSGIYLYSSSNNTIMSNNITASLSAASILLYSSSNNLLGGNTVISSNVGIELTYSSSYNRVEDNTAASNHYGVWLYVSSNYNTIIGNNVTSNTIYGIYLVNLSSSIIYNNNFINNTSQTGLSNSANTWDNGYPSGG
ncbi:MAG TPA: NosD domain-containing protein, partial [Candidatus Acidoferrum sp.]|nr:NosD domain-containing protein [Candidatus Acidoferrum sp.]